MNTKHLVQALLCLLAASGISTASPIPDFPFIVADGRAKREVSPTNATVTFTVLAFAKSSEESTNTVQAALSKVITALKSEGVGENQIRAHDLNKSAVRNHSEDQSTYTEIKGYKVSREVKLKLPDLSIYPVIIRILMAAEHITDVISKFDTSKREEVEAELIGEACAKARKKADLLAKGAGVTIGQVYAVSDRGFADIDRALGLDDWSPSSFAYGLGRLPNIEEIILFVPSTINVEASVNILYKLAP